MRQFSRFVVVGILNSVWGYSLIFGFMWFFGWTPVVSNVAGYAISLITSFFLHRNFTFESQGKRRYEFVKFVIVFCVAYGANIAALYLLVESYNTNAYLSQILAGFLYVVISFVLNKLFVFVGHISSVRLN